MVQDEEFSLSGAVNVEQVINTLPQVIPGTTSFSNNPGGGVATLNLRGLGTQRNLVLVNGRRYIFFDTTQIVDLNTIPQFLIGSVDVVTGGASAVYGSDALVGVVNFRLRTNLDGMIAGGQYSITEEGDGRRYNAYVAIGSQFADGRGHVTAYAEYYNRGQIMQADRDYSFFSLADGAGTTGQTADWGAPVAGLVPGGSAGVPQGRFIAIGGSGATQAGAGTNYCSGTAAQCGTAASTPAGAFFANPGTSRPYVPAPLANNDSYNFAPANYLMVPQERWMLGGYAEYEVTEGINAFAEVTFVNNRVAERARRDSGHAERRHQYRGGFSADLRGRSGPAAHHRGAAAADDQHRRGRLRHVRCRDDDVPGAGDRLRRSGRCRACWPRRQLARECGCR